MYTTHIYSSFHVLRQHDNGGVGIQITHVQIPNCWVSIAVPGTPHQSSSCIKHDPASFGLSAKHYGGYNIACYKQGKLFVASKNGLMPYFNKKYLLTQNESRKECHVQKYQVSCVIACLSGKLHPIVSLLRLTTSARNTGIFAHGILSMIRSELGGIVY